MSDDEKPSTLFAIRLQGKNKAFWKQMWQAAILLGCIFGFFGVIFGIQYYVCKSDSPNISVVECFSRNPFDKKRK